MSQASASHTQSRRSLPSILNLRTNVRDRLGPIPDNHAHLGPQGNVHERLGSWGGQTDNHHNEDREERHSAASSQRNIHERLGPHRGQLDNPHNEDNEEMCSVARSRRTNSRRQVTKNLSQAQSLNTPPRQRNRESRPLQTKEEVNQPRPSRKGHQRGQPAMCAEDVKTFVNNRLQDLKIGGNFKDALRIEMDRANSSPFTAEIE
ncbi:unnamed protein product [Prunus armeniaca]